MMHILVGNKLKKLRKAKAWSQEQVADLVCISQSAYARIESGESHSWAIYINKICEVFEITPEELIKSKSIISDKSQQVVISTDAIIINQLSEKLIVQYEEKIEELKQVIVDLKRK